MAAHRHRRPQLTLGLLLGSAALASASIGLAQPPGPVAEDDWRDPHDIGVLRQLEHQAPGARAELETGEALLREGQLEKARDLFRSLTERAPENGIVWRRYCQTLTRLGRREQAIAACKEAVGRAVLSPSLRATVGALMLAPPAPMELNLAVRYAEEAKRRQPQEPWGLAAECDIAERLGDEVMLNQCTQELARVVPGHYETQRRLRATETRTAPRWTVVAWLMIALATLGTAIHAVLGLRRRASAAAAATAGVLLWLAPAASHAQALPPPDSAAEAPAVEDEMGEPVAEGGIPAGGLSRFKVNHEDPTRDIPTEQQRNRDPIHFGYFLMDLADLAQEATNKGDHKQAAKYWEATAKAVPEAALGYRNACASWDKAGELARALTFCRNALGVQGVKLLDHDAYARLLMKKEDALTALEVEDVSEMIKHLQTEIGGKELADQLNCELGAKVLDVKRLTECTTQLAKTAPNDPKTISYSWALAMAKNDIDQAEDLVARAQKAGVSPEGVRKMIATTAKAGSWSMKLQLQSKLLIGIVGCLTILIVGFGTLFRRELRAWWLARREAKAPGPLPAATSAGTPAT